jgi:biotin carboxyl carrier protein
MLVLEAMKMQNSLTAGKQGKVRQTKLLLISVAESVAY